MSQDTAISALARSIRPLTSGLTSPNRAHRFIPVLGPTGVGKDGSGAHAGEFLSQDKSLIRSICRNSWTKHSVSQVIGRLRDTCTKKAGQLTERVKRSPLICRADLDVNRESAPDVFNILWPSARR